MTGLCRTSLVAGAIALLVAFATVWARADSAAAKMNAPEYLVVMVADGPVELTAAELEAWIGDARPIAPGSTAERPASAVDAVAFWGPTTLTAAERAEFAGSGFGQRSAGWWAADADGSGGRLALRGTFLGGQGTIGQEVETVYETDAPMPVQVSVTGGQGRDWMPWLFSGGAGLMVAIAAAVAWMRRAGRLQPATS